MNQTVAAGADDFGINLPARPAAGPGPGRACGISDRTGTAPPELGAGAGVLGHHPAPRPEGQEDRLPRHTHQRAPAGHYAQGRRGRRGSRRGRAGQRGLQPGRGPHDRQRGRLHRLLLQPRVHPHGEPGLPGEGAALGGVGRARLLRAGDGGQREDVEGEARAGARVRSGRGPGLSGCCCRPRRCRRSVTGRHGRGGGRSHREARHKGHRSPLEDLRPGRLADRREVE